MMKTLRWIFGFPLAIVVTIGLLYITIMGADSLRLTERFYLLEQALGLGGIIFDLVVWILLTALFIPTNKRLAAAIPSICIFALTVLLIWFFITKRSNTDKADINILIYFIVGMVVSPFIGFSLSYIIFKDKGWRRTGKDKPVKDLAEIYEEEITHKH